MVKQLASRSASIGVIAGLFAIAIPTPSDAIIFGSRNYYERCAADLTRAGISQEQTAVACSEALRPDDVGVCVVRISRQQSATAQEALYACRQVRRPRELATCFTRIRDRVSAATVPAVLDNCRRSLKPTRFADCVIGIHRETQLEPNQILNTCISGSDIPRDYGQTLIPIGGTSPQTAPSQAPTTETPTPATEAAPQPSPSPSASPQSSPTTP